MWLLSITLALALPVGPPAPDAARALPSLEAPPPPTEEVVATWTAGEYLEHLVERQSEAIRRANAAVEAFRANPSQAALDAMLARLEGITRAERDSTRQLPAWHGDATLRDAMAADYQAVCEFVTRELPKIRALYAKETAVETDLVGAEALEVDWLTRKDESARRMKEAEELFAARNQIILLPPVGDGTLPAEEHFDAPDLVPPGGHLHPESYAGFANRYQNGRIAHYNRISETVGVLYSGTSGDAAALELARDRARTEVQVVLAEQDADGPWLGDRSLLDANRGFGEAVLTAIDGDLAAYQAILANPHRNQADVDEANAIAARLNTDLRAAQQAAADAYRPFEARWRLDEFRAWSQSHVKAVPAGEAPRAEPSPP